MNAICVCGDQGGCQISITGGCEPPSMCTGEESQDYLEEQVLITVEPSLHSHKQFSFDFGVWIWFTLGFEKPGY